MEITVNVNAPAIVDALNNFTAAVTAVLKAPQATTLETALDHVVTAAPVPTRAVAAAPVAPAPVVTAVPAPAAPVAPAPVVAAAPVAPTPAPAAPAVDEAYRNRVCQAAARLVEAGKMNDILNALKSFNVAAVTQLTAEQLPAFAAQITTLGAVV